ncbi:aminodeoxychorismate/anthranilate synthase component II [Parachlamydia sp. AcF125]|uniref:anthranilate synthase component II n=1 Tax=Parachlamydia sp. AcF125 TaxID=2795736 RepID=UPI001BCA1275|nr:aminodeoxychorismate/anthranilate synthase component II [Parachlamydia sp. AcF125]MBS4168629.1 Anthranilate synthase component 2 [Parachlamydia sp. AcF125]
MLLFIDNLDSFTYNLVHLFQELGASVHLLRSPFFCLDECIRLNPTHIVVGPGPGSPQEYPYFASLLSCFSGKVPMLGVCLGHQGIAQLYGAQVKKALKPMHGKASAIYHQKKGIFHNLPSPFSAIRYHSLIVDRANFPACLEITAQSIEGEIMGFKHSFYQIEGVQFHPESVKSEYGARLFQNFLNQTC